MAVKNELSCVPIIISTFLECVWVLLNGSSTDILIGVFYRPPDMVSAFVEEFYRILSEVCNRFPNCVLLIFGDFNYPRINWATLSVTESERESNAFLQSCLDFSLSQLIMQPTRRTATCSSILDLILTNTPDICANISHLDGLSDHDVITGDIVCRHNSKKIIEKTIKCYSRANFDGMNAQLSLFADQFLNDFLSRTVEENWVAFKNMFTDVVNKYIPSITIRNRSSTPWFNKQLRRLNNKKKRLYRQAQKSSLAPSWLKYKQCDKEYQELLKSSRGHFFNHDLSSMLTNNPRKFWQVINPSNHPDVVLTDPTGATVPESKCAQILNNAFSSVFTREDVTSCPNIGTLSEIIMPQINITESGIISLLNNRKVSSASDHVGFNNKLLKSTSQSISGILRALFSQSLSSGQIPNDWRTAKVIPIFKSGDRSSPLNYRPISLTSTVCKLLEHIIHSQIMKYLEEHNIIFKYQHGFRKGYSCDGQLAGFTNDLLSCIDAGNQVDAIFLDYSKAFDRVPHHRLLLKLKHLNIDEQVIAWIKDFLSFRTQFTNINHCNSPFIPVTSGVPQGSVLGPLLFLIYINDLPNRMSSRVRLFADDCVIYRTIYTDTDPQALQSDLNAINRWCSDWQMTLNHTKTKCMSFTHSSSRIPTSYFIGNNAVELTTTYKYLGINLQSDLTWHHHINLTLASANRTFGIMKHRLKQAPSHLKKLAYTTLIRPKIEYACAIWDPSQDYIIRNIESLQSRAARFIFSDFSPYSSVTSLKIRAELPPLSLRRKHARLSLFHKLYHHDRLRDDFFQSPPVIFPRRDHPCKVKRPACHSAHYAHSFIPKTIADWNNLPSDIATEVNTDQFHQMLWTHIRI